MIYNKKTLPLLFAFTLGMAPFTAFAQGTHVVKSGDSLWGISQKHKVSVADIKKINNLKSDFLFVGQKISLNKGAVSSAPTTQTHTVKSGDTLYGLSIKYKVSVNNLKTWNNLKTNNLFIGQKLKINTSTGGAVSAPETPKVEAKVYTVKKGDTLYGISKQLKVSVSDIKKWNKLKSDMLSVNQKLSINGVSVPNTSEPTSPTIVEKKTGKVTATVLNMRKGAGTNFASIAGLKLGTVVTILSQSNGWSQVDYNGTKGWVSTDYLQISTEAAPTKHYEINATSLNIRTGPGTTHSILMTLKNGTVVQVLEEKNGWSRISYNGKEGWASSEYISGDANVANPNGKVVILDAGHGGGDPGALAPDKTKESDIVLSISQKTKQALIDQGFTVKMVRENDESCASSTSAELKCRVNFSNDNGGDVFVSIHANSIANAPSARGTETYYSTQNPKTTESAKLASAIHDEYQPAFSSLDRKVKTANYYVIGSNNKLPAVLLEVGFMSNSSDLYRLKSSAVQQDVAKSIAEGVNEYFGY